MIKFNLPLVEISDMSVVILKRFYYVSTGGIVSKSITLNIYLISK